MPRAVDDLDAWHLASLREFSDLNVLGLESFVERDIVQAVSAGPTQMKDFDCAVLLVAGKLDPLQRIGQAGSLGRHDDSFLCDGESRAGLRFAEAYSCGAQDSMVVWWKAREAPPGPVRRPHNRVLKAETRSGLRTRNPVVNDIRDLNSNCPQ